MKFFRIPTSCIRLAVILLALLASGTTLVAEQALLEVCDKDIRAGQSTLQDCLPIPVDGSITYPLQERASLVPDPGDPGWVCDFLFWTADGRQYLPDDLPAELRLDGNDSVSAVAWYSCGREGANGIPRVSYTAIDMTSGNTLSDPFIASFVPDTGASIGDCLVSAPCSSLPGADPTEVTAQGRVGDLVFRGWHGEPSSQQTIDPQPGLPEIALYTAKEADPACRLLRNPKCRPAIDLENFDLVPDWEIIVDLDRICLYVLNCPGCGPEGLCPGWRLTFDDFEEVEVELHHLERGLVARAERLQKGAKVLEFQPMAREGQPTDGYFLRFRLAEGYERAVRVPLGAKLATVCGKQ